MINKPAKSIYTHQMSHLLYGIRLWGNTYHKHVKKLESVQKRAVRAIMGAKYNDPSMPLIKILNILKLKDLYELQTMHFVYDFVNLFVPRPLPVIALILNLQK